MKDLVTPVRRVPVTALVSTLTTALLAAAGAMNTAPAAHAASLDAPELPQSPGPVSPGLVSSGPMSPGPMSPGPVSPVYGASPPYAVAPTWAGDADAHGRAVGCLADAVYYEAANQPLEGRQAVAQVVLNRVGHPRYPKSVCEVVYQGAPRRGCQFTFACDGSLARSREGAGWRDAVTVAEQALAGFVDAAVGASTHYHTLVVHPAWSDALTPTVRIAAHQFYRLPRLGDADVRAAYAGHEPIIALRTAMALRKARTARDLLAAPPAPQSATFSVWGVQVARVVPHAGEVTVAASGT